MSVVAIVDYAMGNLHSMAKAVEHVCRGQVVVTANPEVILAADRVVFPGQGAARDCMHEIRAAELQDVLLEVAKTKPFLGVCMGLQVLLSHSEEGGGVDCLGLFPGEVRYFGERLVDEHSGARLKIPQMGWNQVHQCSPHPLWRGVAQDSRFYFVHSYYVDPDDKTLVVGTTDYSRVYPSVLARENVFAVQFHPEKSQHDGLALLKNFVEWEGTC